MHGSPWPHQMTRPHSFKDPMCEVRQGMTNQSMNTWHSFSSHTPMCGFALRLAKLFIPLLCFLDWKGIYLTVLCELYAGFVPAYAAPPSLPNPVFSLTCFPPVDCCFPIFIRKGWPCHDRQFKFAPFFSGKNSASVWCLVIEYVVFPSVYFLLACPLLPRSMLFPVTSEPSDSPHTKTPNNMRAQRSKAPQITVSCD